MSNLSFEEMKDEVHEFLLESDEPWYHEDLADTLGYSTREIGQTLMTLMDEDRVEWPTGDEWVAVADEEKTIEGGNAKINIGVVND